MSGFLNRLGHLPQHIESEAQIRLWVNALVWELDIDLASWAIGEQPRDSRGVAVLNPLESQVFERFFKEAKKMNLLYLELAIQEETRAKTINDKLWAERDIVSGCEESEDLVEKWAASEFELEEIWKMWRAGMYRPPCANSFSMKR
jgi:hypothetical protein